MLNQATLDQLRTLKLQGFVDELQQQAAHPGSLTLSFDERLALLVQREVLLREDRKRTRLLQRAKLKYAQAAIEDLDTRPGRGFDRATLIGLATSSWVEHGNTVLLTGPTGVGKTWLACALAQHACRAGRSSLYLRVPRLSEELRALHASGGFSQWLQALAKTDVLVLDDWGVAALEPSMRTDLLEIIDDRAALKATIITTQLPVDHWHAWIGDPTIADAILDRLTQRIHRINLTGESMRRTSTKPSKKPPNEPRPEHDRDRPT